MASVKDVDVILKAVMGVVYLILLGQLTILYMNKVILLYV